MEGDYHRGLVPVRHGASIESPRMAIHLSTTYLKKLPCRGCCMTILQPSCSAPWRVWLAAWPRRKRVQAECIRRRLASRECHVVYSHPLPMPGPGCIFHLRPFGFLGGISEPHPCKAIEQLRGSKPTMCKESLRCSEPAVGIPTRPFCPSSNPGQPSRHPSQASKRGSDFFSR